jgi:hypothetical protein
MMVGDVIVAVAGKPVATSKGVADKIAETWELGGARSCWWSLERATDAKSRAEDDFVDAEVSLRTGKYRPA